VRFQIAKGVLEIVTFTDRVKVMAVVIVIKGGLHLIVQLGHVRKTVLHMEHAEQIFLLLNVTVIVDGLVLIVLRYLRMGPAKITVHSMDSVWMVNVNAHQSGKEMIAASPYVAEASTVIFMEHAPAFQLTTFANVV